MSRHSFHLSRTSAARHFSVSTEGSKAPLESPKKSSSGHLALQPMRSDKSVKVVGIGLTTLSTEIR